MCINYRKIGADEDGKTNKMLSVQTSLISELQDRIEQLNNEKIKYKLLLEEKNAEIVQIEREHFEVYKHFNNKIKELETSLSKQISINRIQYSDNSDTLMESNAIRKFQTEIAELKHDNYKLKMMMSGLMLNQEGSVCKMEMIEELDLSAYNKEFSDIQLKIENLVDNLTCTVHSSSNQELDQEFDLMTCADVNGLTQLIENLVDNLLNAETDYNQETVHTQTNSADFQYKQLTEFQTNIGMKDKETTELLNQLTELLVKSENLQKNNEQLTELLIGKKFDDKNCQT